ncbi:MAG: 50S ribosomal protein L25 [Myxococcales bacterium]
MNSTTLRAVARAESGKGPARRLRVQGQIPAVIYGGTEQPLSLSVASKDVVAVLQGPYGVNTLLSVEVEGAPAPVLAMIRDHQIHPVKRKLLHCDLYRLAPDKPVTVTVPLSTSGKSVAEKLGGRVRIIAREIAVSCLPADIPLSIDFDVTALSTAKTIYATEVPLPANVSPGWRNNFAVLAVSVPKVEGEA